MVEWDYTVPKGKFLRDHIRTLRTALEVELLELGTVEHVYFPPEVAAMLEVVGFEFETACVPNGDPVFPVLDWNGRMFWVEVTMPRDEIHVRTQDGERFPIIKILNP